MINENLERKILSDIPENYTNLKKALLIYKRLCETVDYSLEYYLKKDEVIEKFTNKANLKNVDGETNKEIVCITFNAILVELFKKAGVINDPEFDIVSPGYREDGDHFRAEHHHVCLKIDDIYFNIEGTNNIINENDLILSKYSTYMPTGWTVFPFRDEDNEHMDEYYNILTDSIEDVYFENRSLENNVEQYIESNDEYINLPLEERFNLFMDVITNNAEYNLLGFNKILRLKHSLFKGSEIITSDDHKAMFGRHYMENKNLDISFVVEKDTGEYKVLVYYNPEGYSELTPEKTIDSLKVYEVSLANHSCQELSRGTVIDRFNKHHYIGKRNETVWVSRMVDEEDYDQ